MPSITQISHPRSPDLRVASRRPRLVLTPFLQLMLAEFKYGGQPAETFGALADQRIPRRPFYHLAKDVFPYAYFKHMVKGEWFGPKGLVPPVFPA